MIVTQTLDRALEITQFAPPRVVTITFTRDSVTAAMNTVARLQEVGLKNNRTLH